MTGLVLKSQAKLDFAFLLVNRSFMLTGTVLIILAGNPYALTWGKMSKLEAVAFISC